MVFWIFMLLTVLLIPCVMLWFGRLFAKQAPREINWLFGYRTRRSMRNRETWEFAHRYSGGLMRKWGVALLPLSLVGMLGVWGRGEDVVGVAGAVLCLMQIIPFLIVIAQTERALKEAFDEQGHRR